MSYHIFNYLSRILNIDLSSKLGNVNHYWDFIGKTYNCSHTSIVNGKYAFEEKCCIKCQIYKKYIVWHSLHRQHIKKLSIKVWMVISQDLNFLSNNGKNHIHLQYTRSNTLPILKHTHTYIFVWNSGQLIISILLEQWRHLQNLIVVYVWRIF